MIWLTLSVSYIAEYCFSWHPVSRCIVCMYSNVCAKKKMCAEATGGVVIRTTFAWHSPWMHVRQWIQKHFVCWCAYRFNHMFKVHVWIGVQFPASGWSICMTDCKCVCCVLLNEAGAKVWWEEYCVCLHAGRGAKTCKWFRWQIDEVTRNWVSAFVCVYMCELLS